MKSSRLCMWVVIALLSGAISSFAQSIPTITSVIYNASGNSIIPVGGAMFVDGSGFGDSQGAGTLTLNGTVVTPYFWSDTSVHAFIPNNMTPGPVAVQITTAGGSSNAVNITVTGQPTITAISPTSGTAGTTLTITGTNFGAAPFPSPNTSAVWLSPGQQLTPISWTDTQIVTTIPPGAAPLYSSVVVAVNGLSGVSQQQFVTNPNPHITAITPTSGSIGTPITINGSGFSIPEIIHLVYIGGVLANVVSWSDTQVVATVGSGAQTGTTYVAVTTPDGQSYVNSNGVPFTFVPASGPLLQLSISDAPLRVNLTSPQVLDWIHWGRISASVPDRKDGIAPLISDYTAFNGAQPSASSGNIAFSWTDGNHPAVVSEANEDVETFNTASGFQITVPADTAAKTLNLYAEVFFGQAVLQATLNDGSATAISDQSVIDSDVGSKVYSIDFRAASAGQTLTVTLASAATSSGGVGLQAATLTPHLPVVGIASPLAGQSFTTSSVVPVSVNASQLDSSINDVKAANSDNTVLESSASPLNANLGPLAGGHYSIAGTATDTTALLGTSAPVEFDVIGQGGTLSIQENVPSSPVNLDVQGSADWVLWGPVNTGDSLFDVPGFILARKASVAPLISEYKPIGNHFITSQAFAHSLCFAGDQQNYCSGSEITVHGKGNGFEITVAADTTPRTLQLYVGTLAADGVVTAFLSDGSAPVATEVGGSGPPQTNTTLYTINYSAASAGRTLTVRFTLDTDQGDGQVTLIGAALSGSSEMATAPAPQIASIDPTTSPVNTQVSISGLNFGASQGTSAVLFGQTLAQVVSWSDAGITALVPDSFADGATVDVAVSTANGTSNSVKFTIPSFQIYPSSLAIAVGQAGTVMPRDSQGNVVLGLGWATKDDQIVGLSTDDPPIITGLSPGTAKVYAGDVPFTVTVYPGSSLPPGTPVWSTPVTGSLGNINMVPAVPNDSGADLLVLDGSGTLTAFASDSRPVWKVNVLAGGSVVTIVPDFSGAALLKTPFAFADVQGNAHLTHVVKKVNPTTQELSQLYVFSDHPTNSSGFTDDSNTQIIIPHTSGSIFVQDNATVHVLDSNGNTLSDISLEPSTWNGITSQGSMPPVFGQMVVAGDRNGYLPYMYFVENTTVTPGSPFETVADQTVMHLMALRVSPDGTFLKTELNSWTANHVQESSGAITCSGATLSQVAPPRVLKPITQADQGIAIFTSASFLRPLIGITGDCGQGGGAVDPLPPDLQQVSFVGQNGAFSNASLTTRDFVPVLQRSDGAFIGTDHDNTLVAVALDGTPIWQTKVDPDPNGVATKVKPLYAIPGGAVISTSTSTLPDGTKQLGTLYTVKDGAETNRTPDFGKLLAWSGNWYGASSSNGPAVTSYALDPITFDSSFLPHADGVLSPDKYARHFTKEITVIGWIDPMKVALPDPGLVNPNLPIELRNTIACPVLLKSLSTGDRSSISNDPDRQFVNAFLIQQSANAEPPPTLDPSVLKEGDFRAYSRAQAVIDPIGNQILQAQLYNTKTVLGDTPDSCHSVFTSLGNFIAFGGKLLKSEAHTDNDKSGVAPGRLHVFHVAEGRVGAEAQAANRTLNACLSTDTRGFCNNPVPPVTPYIWAITKFDYQGQYTVDTQIFPSYYVYEDGKLIPSNTRTQNDVEQFIKLNAESQIKASDIR